MAATVSARSDTNTTTTTLTTLTASGLSKRPGKPVPANSAAAATGSQAIAAAPSVGVGSTEGNVFTRAGIYPTAVNRVEWNKYQPDTPWYNSHYFYGADPSLPPTAARGGAPRASAAELTARYHSTNMAAVHAMLVNSVTPDGLISLDAVQKMIRLNSPPRVNTDYVARWFLSLGVPVDNCLPYEKVIEQFDMLFNSLGAQKNISLCFDLCDIHHNGFILKDVFRKIRNEQTETPDLHHLIVKAVMGGFEHVARAEEDKARAAAMKGKKKAKKNLVLQLPSKRQFHISRAEFAQFMSKDPFMVAAFLPFVLKRTVEEAGGAPGAKSQAQLGAPVTEST